MNKLLWTLVIFLTITLTFAIKPEKTEETQTEEGTRVVFYIQKQIQQPKDYVEINIQIKSQKPSLEQAIDQSKHIVSQVESIVTKYCESHAKNKKDCEGVVQTSEYQIDPIYQLVRKVPTFVAFSVVFETVAKIKDVKGIGKLTDDILKAGITRISSFEWKPIEEVDNEQDAVTEGIELVKSICEKMGSKLGRIVAVQEVTDYEEEEEEEPAKEEGEEQQAEEEEEEEEEPTVVYRFDILCQNKTEKGKK